jgi:hypothetical protein
VARAYDPGVLAYVFWHVPAAGAAGYEARLAAFHAALRADAPAGLGPTATVALDSVPWLGGAPGYEDWYLVDDFEALGVLNVAAVSGRSKQPHDAAAAVAGPGIAGLMAHLAGRLMPESPRWAAWLAKPAGLAYGDFHEQLAAALPDGAGAWQRQMVLGPATEYCVLAGAPLELPWPVAHAWPLRVAVPTAS